MIMTIKKYSFLVPVVLTILFSGFFYEATAQKKIKKSKQVFAVPTRGHSVSAIKGRNMVVLHGGKQFQYSEGVYYKNASKRYVVVSPPFGIRVKYLPSSYLRLAFGSNFFFFYNGIFYKKYPKSEEYEVIQPPIGARVPELSEGATVVVLDGQKYYELDGYYYKEIITYNNQLLYEVVELDRSSSYLEIGTLVPTLPSGSKVVIIDGKKYHSGDGYYYEEMIIEGKLYYKVSGKG